MNERNAAEEHLRVIRSLMERATVYRAISAPTALVGGLSALAVAAWLLWRAANASAATPFAVREFAAGWIVALLITGTANTLFIWQEARRDQRTFLSPGLRLALRSIIPSMFVAGVVTLATLHDPRHGAVTLAMSWIALYGLALLATMNFAPRSLSYLGGSFVICATAWLFFQPEALRGERGATLAMAITFGVFHLIYAACTWQRGRTVERPLPSE